MSDYVADTHALFWYLTGSRRLGPDAKAAFEEAEIGAAIIYVPAIVLAELYYLNVKAGRPLSFKAEFEKLKDAGLFEFIPMEADHVLEFDQDSIPEMHDRLIVGATRRLNAACLTKDSEIVDSGLVTTVW